MRRIKSELADNQRTKQGTKNQGTKQGTKNDLPLTAPSGAASMHSFNATRQRQGRAAER
jgi:hypothetical protein